MARNLPPDPHAQRTAMRYWVDRHGTIETFASQYSIALRQVQRFADGTQMIPPRLCRQIEQAERDNCSAAKADHVAAAFAILADSHSSEQQRQRAARSGHVENSASTPEADNA